MGLSPPPLPTLEGTRSARGLLQVCIMLLDVFLVYFRRLMLKNLAAYDDVMYIMCVAATAFAVVPLVLSLFMPNWYLGDTQNAVEGVNLAGERTDEEGRPTETRV